MRNDPECVFIFSWYEKSLFPQVRENDHNPLFVSFFYTFTRIFCVYEKYASNIHENYLSLINF